MSTPFTMIDAPLGRSSRQIHISLLPFPDISEPNALKARAFDYCMDALTTHRDGFEFAELSSFITHHVPTSDGTALHQALDMGTAIRNAVFDIRNLTGIGFFDAKYHRIDEDDLMNPPHQRPKDIMFVLLEALIHPHHYFPQGSIVSDTHPLLLTFRLRLPQHTISLHPFYGPANRAHSPQGSVTTNEPDADDDAQSVPADADDPDNTGNADTYTPDDLRRQLAIDTPQPYATTIPTPLPIGLASPRFTLRSDTTHTTTYTGDYSFLDNQARFERTFPSKTFHGTDASLTTQRLTAFVHECQYSVFTQLLRLDYVGSSRSVDMSNVIALTSQIRKLRMTGKEDKTSTITSTESLFNAFLRLATLLPKEAGSWGLCLAHQYVAALTEECRSNLETQPGFQLPDPSGLSTKESQLSALRTVRTFATSAQHRLDELFRQQSLFMVQYAKSMKKTTTFASTSNPPSSGEASHTTATTLYSPAESVIRQNSTHATTPYTPIPAVTTITTSSGTYPVNPTTGYQSKFTLDFQGCLGCGAPDHNSFRACPRNADADIKKGFFLELFAHKPRYRLNSEQKQAARNSHSRQPALSPYAPPTATPPVTTGYHNYSTIDHNSAASSQKSPPAPNPIYPLPPYPTTLPIPPTLNPDTNKRTRYYVTTARSCSALSSIHAPPMPIAIDNGFPYLTVDLGDSQSTVSLSGLFDTCGSLNTGYLPFHAWIASQHPHIVDDFCYSDGTAPFDPVKLEGAVSAHDSGVKSTHGLLTALVRYKTPYVDDTGSPISLSFALGNDVATNTIFGLPTITALGFLFDAANLTAYSRCLNTTFPLTKSAGTLGFPDNISFDPAVHRRIHEAGLVSAPSHLSIPFDTADTTRIPPRLISEDDCSQGYLRRTITPLTL